MSSEEFFQYLVFGIQDGSIYALIGLGFTIIYSVTNIINFAQGEFVMLGGMMSYMSVDSAHVPTGPKIVVAILAALALAMFLYSTRSKRIHPVIAVISIVSVLGCIPLTLLLFGKLATAELNVALSSIIPVAVVGLAGGILYLLAIRPARKPSNVSLIIITIGASLCIKGIAGEMWGISGQRTPVYWDRGSLEFMGAIVSTQTLWIVSALVIITVLLQLFFSYTMLGKSLKACAVNPVGAGLVGVNPKTMALIAFILAAMIGAVIGAVMTPKTGMDYERGFVLGLYGFLAASLGGFKSHIAVVVGGLLIGITMNLIVGLSWGPFISGYKDVWAMGILLAILLLRSSKLAEEERTS
ncbi:MAG: branched-chain amino acid ABC transporter permease [Dehalococcoidia bacterium]|nr:branched-chain amino acid ABC transporter permease [Dehalococcoidia bacterium]